MPPNRIVFSISLIFCPSHLYLSSLAPSPPPLPLCRAATVQPRDGRQIKTTLFPLCSSHHPGLILSFFISFSSVSFSWNHLELPGIKLSPNLTQHHLFYFGLCLNLRDAHFFNNHDSVIMFVLFGFFQDFSDIHRHTHTLKQAALVISLHEPPWRLHLVLGGSSSFNQGARV